MTQRDGASNLFLSHVESNPQEFRFQGLNGLERPASVICFIFGCVLAEEKICIGQIT